jgi:hypothetical protein
MPSPTITSEIRLPADKDNSPAYIQSRGKNENGKTGSAASSWSAVFMSKPPPPSLCTDHREPSKELRVNKPGPSKGKTFHLCARRSGLGVIKAVMRDYEKSTTSTNAISSYGRCYASCFCRFLWHGGCSESRGGYCCVTLDDAQA